MSSWFSGNTACAVLDRYHAYGVCIPVDAVQELQTKLDDCGTSACVAGWAVLLSPAPDVPVDNVADTATELLDLDEKLADGLFLQVYDEQVPDVLRWLLRWPDDAEPPDREDLERFLDDLPELD